MTEPQNEQVRPELDDDTDLDMPADVETEDNPLRDPETGEPVPADAPDDVDG